MYGGLDHLMHIATGTFLGSSEWFPGNPRRAPTRWGAAEPFCLFSRYPRIIDVVLFCMCGVTSHMHGEIVHVSRFRWVRFKPQHIGMSVALPWCKQGNARAAAV